MTKGQSVIALIEINTLRYLGIDEFSITIGMFGVLLWILYLLFHPTLALDDTHRDLLNILLGSFIASFGKCIDFWFRHSKKKETK